jgi:glyoxylase-like metal-dependent hydrolase (beta-lactamase superfamily II)
MRQLTRSIVAGVLFALAPLAGAQVCPADCDGDGKLTILDFVCFQNAFVAGDEGADCDRDGELNILDFVCYQNLFVQGCSEKGTFPKMWINGGDCATEPTIQVHQYDDDTYILRQSLCTNFEGPFMYLLFGDDKVLMQDTGANDPDLPLAETVYAIIDDWLEAHDKESIQLVVTHSHSHGDHVAHDNQFIGQPNTVVVGKQVADVVSFFGFQNWPLEPVTFDLGGREIDVIGIPGHHATHIALFDAQTGILFTGDTLYPGRLYISSFGEYLMSIQRLVDFTAARSVCWVLGTHIEMSNTPGDDYPFGATFHPDEHPLQLTRDHLLELNQAVIGMQDDPKIEVHDDFIVYPLN